MKQSRVKAVFALTLLIVMLTMGVRSFAASSPARVSLDLKMAELAEVFRVLADVSGANIVVSPSVSGKVTVKLSSVPVEEALDIICSVSDLEYIYLNGTILVGPKGSLSKASAKETSVEKLELISITASDAAAKLSFAIPGITVQPDDKSNTILIRGTQADIALAKAFLAKVDTPALLSKAPLPEEEIIEIIQLSNAEATSVYDAISKLLKAKLAVDVRLNAILAGGTVPDVRDARLLVEKLDVAKKTEAVSVQPVEIRVLQLANASATDVKAVASLILPQDRIQADAKSNSLIVKATSEEHQKVADLVKTIEAATPKSASVATAEQKLEIVTLLYAKAQDVKEALQVILPAGNVVTDERTNKVIMLVDARQGAEAMALIRELDVRTASVEVKASEAPAMRLGYYNPQIAKATDVVAVVRLVSSEAKIQIIEANNSIVAFGTEADHAVIAEAVKKLDEEAKASIKVTTAIQVAALEVVELKYAAAADVQKALASVLSIEKVSMDSRTNKILMRITPDEKQLAMNIIEALDVSIEKPTPVQVVAPSFEVVQLQFAQAAEVQKALQSALPSAGIAVDERTNKLLIKATPEDMKTALSIVDELDIKLETQAVVPPEAESLEVVNLKYAKASEIKPVLDDALGQGKVSADDRSNKIIMMVTPSGRQLASSIIAAMDVDVATKVQVTVLPAPETVQLKYAAAADVKKVLDGVLGAANVSADERTNKLVIMVTPAGKAVAMDIIGNLDVEVAPEPKQPEVQVAAPGLEIVAIKYAKASEVRDALLSVVSSEKLAVDERTNKLIMSLTADEIAQARAIISELDVPIEGQAAVAEEPILMGFYKLYNVKPSEIEPSVKVVAGSAKVQASDATGSITAYGTPSELGIIESLIQKLDVSRTKEEAVVSIVTETLEVIQLTNAPVATVKASLSVLLPASKLSVDERTNKIMMIVTPELKEQALSVIAALDVPVATAAPVVAAPVKLGFFQLKYASAKDMEAPVKLVASGAKVQVADRTNSLIIYGTDSEIALIEQVIAKLDVEIKQPQAVINPEEEYRTYKMANASPSDISAALTIILPASSMMPDDRSGSLIIKATPSVHEIAAGVITTLDVKGKEEAPVTEDEVTTRVYKLNHATPSDLKTALAESTTGKISVDTRTSSLIVTAKASEQEGIVEIINQLDQELAQVFFEASLYELSDDATKRLGIDWTINKLVFGYNTLSQLATVSLDFDNKIAALADEGKAKLISKQHTFTVDGKAGRMLIGDRIPVIVQNVDQGQVVNAVEYINAGIELSILPKVSYDGSITAEVKPVISSIIGWTPQNYPQIRTRELETIVTVKNGESAIIGGLFSQEEIETITKVPILGEIPLLKELFTKRGTDVKDQEIIIVITAWIIRPGQTTGIKDGIVEIKGPVL